MRVNFVSDTDMLPDSIKPLPEPMLLIINVVSGIQDSIASAQESNPENELEDYTSIAISLRDLLVDKIFSFIHKDNGAVS